MATKKKHVGAGAIGRKGKDPKLPRDMRKVNQTPITGKDIAKSLAKGAISGLTLAIPGKLGASLAGKAKTLYKSAKTKNVVVPAKEGGSKLLGGRTGTPTYAYRVTKADEIEDIRKTGRALANPANKHAKNQKWWSEGDEQGIFGRTWNKGNERVRTKISNVKPRGAVKKSQLERFSKEKNAWEPLKQGGPVGKKK